MSGQNLSLSASVNASTSSSMHSFHSLFISNESSSSSSSGSSEELTQATTPTSVFFSAENDTNSTRPIIPINKAKRGRPAYPRDANSVIIRPSKNRFSK